MIASIPSPSHNGFYIGPVFFHAYGLMYVIAAVAAIMITRRRWIKLGGDPDLPYKTALWAFPAGIVGARIYFLITTPSQVPDHWWGPFAIWRGGLGVWGGIAAGALVGVWYLRKHLSRHEIALFCDAAAPALLVAQAIGRIGNYFNQELFGRPSSLPWALQISVSHRPPGYLRYPTFEPTFLYELLWNLLLAAALVWLGHHRRIRAPGLFALYVAGYSGFRIFEETQRIDYSQYVLGMRTNFWIASIVCIAAVIWFVKIQRRRPSADDDEPPAAARASADGAGGGAALATASGNGAPASGAAGGRSGRSRRSPG